MYPLEGITWLTGFRLRDVGGPIFCLLGLKVSTSMPDSNSLTFKNTGIILILQNFLANYYYLSFTVPCFIAWGSSSTTWRVPEDTCLILSLFRLLFPQKMRSILPPHANPSSSLYFSQLCSSLDTKNPGSQNDSWCEWSASTQWDTCLRGSPWTQKPVCLLADRTLSWWQLLCVHWRLCFPHHWGGWRFGWIHPRSQQPDAAHLGKGTSKWLLV